MDVTTRALPRLLVVEITQTRDDAWYHDELERLNVNVVDVARASGWEPRRLFVGDVNQAEIDAALAWSDAVLVTGGEDVTPRLYGGDPDYEGGGGVHHELADERTLEIIRDSIPTARPLLGICRGQQLVNVALGGTLIQHLPSALDHEPPRDAGAFIRHSVHLEHSSVLARRLGETSIPVESAHHQAVDRLGDDLVVTALAEDGTIEALEHRTAPIVCVQWHPEDTGADQRQLPALLDELRDRLPAARPEAAAAG